MSIIPSSSFSKTRYEELLKECSHTVWREFDDGVQLKAHFIFPEEHDFSLEKAPAVVFYHGGFWKSGQVGEFTPWALHLACYGIVSILIEYRQSTDYDVACQDIIEDSQEAWMWVHKNAEKLGLNKDCILVAGSDSGGLMALLLSLSEEHIQKKIPARFPQPYATILFRSILDTEDKTSLIAPYFIHNELKKAYNPFRLLRKNLPPLFLSAGRKDRFISTPSTEKFAKLYGKKNKITFLLHDECDQSFYHFNMNIRAFEQTLNELLNFLINHNVIEASIKEDIIDIMD